MVVFGRTPVISALSAADKVFFCLPLNCYLCFRDKGQEYEVLGVARHSETEETYVVYRPLYGERGLWIRPAALFLETVIVDGRPCPRFQFLAVM